MQSLTLLGYCTEAYLPTRIGMKASSAEQLSVAARLYDVPLSDLSETGLSCVLADYCQRYAPSTTNSKRRAILTLWDAAAAAGLCRPPNRKRVPFAREYSRTPLAWTVAEVERLVTHCRRLSGEFAGIPQSAWWASLVLVIWDTGARVSATISTAADDCNLAERYLMIRAEHQKSRIDRLFWLSDQAVGEIALHYDPCRKRVWPWPHHRRTLFRYFRMIVMDAGLQPDPSMGLFHKLRRSNLSYTAANGGIELAQQQAGHASATTTRRHYIDPRIARQRSAVDVLPKLNLPDDDPQLRLF